MMGDGMNQSEVDDIIGEWGLRAIGIAVPEAGTMNEVYLVTTVSGRVVFRGHRRRDRRRVELEHEVMAHARGMGLPVPATIPTPGGDLVVERGGRYFSLFEHARGRHVPRVRLGEAHAKAMGRTLGALHRALRSFRPADAPRAQHHRDVPAVLRRIDVLLDRVDTIEHPEAEDHWARERLATRATWLQEHVDLPSPTGDETQMVHGDYQDSNLFFGQGEVSGIIDWDKAELRAPGEEVVRAMHLSLKLDVGLCQAFLAAYRPIADLPSRQLDQAVATYSHDRACDLWLYETIYQDGDDRPRRFITPGRFTPFIDQWAEVSSLIDASGPAGQHRGRERQVFDHRRPHN